ncbi:MAG: DUF4296 domain-containing protein [Bacteroidales bacterium]|nr:DUF4296 domain-containing protein [Bacteroidales bacterium]
MKETKNTYIFLLFCLLLTFTSCREASLPEGVIDTATFTQFLTEAVLVESYDKIIVSENRDSLQHLTAAAYDSLYSKYGITKADYDTSIDYYLRNPKLFEDVYSRVVSNLKKYNEQKQKEREKLADTIDISDSESRSPNHKHIIAKQ